MGLDLLSVLFTVPRVSSWKPKFLRRRFVSSLQIADVLPLHNKQLYDCEIFYSRNMYSIVEP